MSDVIAVSTPEYLNRFRHRNMNHDCMAMCTVIRYYNTLLNTEFMIQAPVVSDLDLLKYGLISMVWTVKKTMSMQIV